MRSTAEQVAEADTERPHRNHGDDHCKASVPCGPERIRQGKGERPDDDRGDGKGIEHRARIRRCRSAEMEQPHQRAGDEEDDDI